MARREYSKKISRTLKFSEVTNDEGKYIGGGILNKNRNVNNGIWYQVVDDLVLSKDNEIDSTGRLQIHVGSTRQALQELGTFLLALSNYYPPRQDYSAHLEISDQNGDSPVHFIIHLPVDTIQDRTNFEQVVTVATAQMNADGSVVIETTPQIKKRSTSETDYEGDSSKT